MHIPLPLSSYSIPFSYLSTLLCVLCTVHLPTLIFKIFPFPSRSLQSSSLFPVLIFLLFPLLLLIYSIQCTVYLPNVKFLIFPFLRLTMISSVYCSLLYPCLLYIAHCRLSSLTEGFVKETVCKSALKSIQAFVK